MARLLRHRQTKEAETDTPSLTSTAPHSYSTQATPGLWTPRFSDHQAKVLQRDSTTLNADSQERPLLAQSGLLRNVVNR